MRTEKVTMLAVGAVLFVGATFASAYPRLWIFNNYPMRDPDVWPSVSNMIERAVADFAARGITIDLANSIIVGDTEKDIETGINAGIGRKILVRSGHAIDESATKADEIGDSLADVKG